MGELKPLTRELVWQRIEMTGSKSKKKYLSYEQAYGRPFDDMLVRVPCLTKIKRLIGCEPKLTLNQTLQQVIDYEKSQL